MDSCDMKAWLVARSVAEAKGFGLRVVEHQSNPDTPWGAYLRIAEESLPEFYTAYWQGVDVRRPSDNLRQDPKILIVAPGGRTSLQYHHRRSELWRVLDGPVGVVLGDSEDSLAESVYQPGDVLRLATAKWHRIVGLTNWGRLAEIWQHVDASHPSGEEDIVRVQDDYGR
jgi:mannose-6-phosphate isomerase